MAFMAQMNFLKLRFPNEVETCPNTSQFCAKDYDACTDPRSWSLNENERSQYYLELLSTPDCHLQGGGESSDLKTALDLKNSEIDELKRKLLELSSNDCAAELARLKKELAELKGELDRVKFENGLLKGDIDKIKNNDDPEDSDALKKQLEDVCAEVNKAYADLQKKYDELVDSNESRALCSCKDLDECRNENNDLKNDLKESCGRLGALQRQIDEQEASMQEMAEIIKEQQEKLGEIEQDKLELQHKLNEAIDELSLIPESPLHEGSGPPKYSDKHEPHSTGFGPNDSYSPHDKSSRPRSQHSQESISSGRGHGQVAYDPQKGYSQGKHDSQSGHGQGVYDPLSGRDQGAYDTPSGHGPGAYNPQFGQGQGAHDSQSGHGPGAYNSQLGQGQGAHDSQFGHGPGAYNPQLEQGQGAYDPQTGNGQDLYGPADLLDADNETLQAHAAEAIRQSQIMQNELQIAEAQIAELTQENDDLRQQLLACRNRVNQYDPDSGNESDRGGNTDRTGRGYGSDAEDCEELRRQRDCLRDKFMKLEPELLCLSNMVKDFECLEEYNIQLKRELEERETREIALMNRLELLMQMEKEFYELQKRVCETEKLLDEYQSKTSKHSENITNSKNTTVTVAGEKSAAEMEVAEGVTVAEDVSIITYPMEIPKQQSTKISQSNAAKATAKAAGKATGKAAKCEFNLDELIQTTQETIVAVRSNLQSTNDEKNLSKKLYFGLKNLVKSYEQNFCQFLSYTDDDEYDDECNWCTLDYLIVANDEFVKLKLIRECESNDGNQNSVCALQLKICNLTTCIGELNEIVDGQKNDLALAKCEICGLEDQIHVLRQNIEIERTEYDNIQSQQKLQQLEAELKLKNCEIEKLLSHTKSMDSNICRMITQIKEFENKLANSRTANSVLKQNINELSSMCGCQKSELSERNIELLKLRKQYECIVCDNKIMAENITCLTEELRKRDNSMSCNAIQMKDKINQLQCENEKLRNEVKILNENLGEINFLLSEYELEKKREVNLVKVLDDIDSSLTQLSQPIDNAELQISVECRNTYENLNNTIEKLIKQLEMESLKNITLEKQINRLKKELECQPDNSERQKKLIELQAKLDLYDATNYEKILQIENLKREVKFLSGPSDDIQNENQKLLKCVDKLEMELKYAMARIEAFEKCELLSERNGQLCEQSSQTETREPSFDLVKLKSLYDKEMSNISKSHCDGLRTLQSLHEMQTCDLRSDYENQIQTLRTQIQMLRDHLTNGNGRNEAVADQRPTTCVCACTGVPPLKKTIANKIEVICKRMLNCGIDKLSFDELCFIHEQIYTAALRLQNVNEAGNSSLKKQRSQLENRIKFIEKELKKFRNLLEKLKELQKQRRKLLSAPPNTRSGTKITNSA